MNASQRHLLTLCSALLFTLSDAIAESVNILYVGEADTPAHFDARQGVGCEF